MSLDSQVLRAFGFKSRSVRKVKSSFICSGDGVRTVVRRVETSPAGVAFAHNVKERLFEEGFADTDRFIVSLTGEPFVEHAGGTYVATGHIDAPEANFGDREQFSRITSSTAAMHRLAGCNNGQAVRPDAFFSKQLRVMAGFRKTVLKQSHFSDFDILFLKNYGHYESRMRRAVEIAESCPTGQTPQNLFSHNGLKEETVLFSGGRVYITCFDGCSPESPLPELAGIVKRHFRTAPEPLPLGKIIDIYTNEKPLSESDLRMLLACLLIPDKFYKICAKYYSRRRTWTPAFFMGIMENVNDGSERLDAYISDFFGLTI